MGQSEFYAVAYGNRSGSTGGETGAIARPRAPYRIRHRKVFLWLISTIFVMCLAHLGLGIFISSVVDPNDAYYDAVLRETYSTGTLVSRVRLVFFWVTIPAVLTGLSLYELIQISRNRLPSKWIAASAIVACFIWGIQMALEAVCMWTYPSTDELAADGLCPWFYEGGDGWHQDFNFTAWMTPWVIIPVISMYIVYFSVGMRAVVIDKRDRKEQSASAVPKADSLSLHTLSTSPVAETLLTDTIPPSTRGQTRPPSYFSDGGASFDSYDVKKD